ncbi:phosphate ABC transporter permease PtsA [archaeon]|nr:MAG: phosphate ABC transporter permease PtsA [archaeon]RLG64960.1 MAG: phosphate ABC transporter permease PtsA [archaeon]HDM23674.1 phosphate ABC transporter permease PstA [Candidatus Bathyarchaeota archaeon]
MRKLKEYLMITLVSVQGLLVISVAVLLPAMIFWIGSPSLSLKLFTSSVFEGGLFECIMGTIWMLLGTIAISGPIGVLAAIYLVEYAPRSSKIVRVVDQSINNLAGVPSIVIGLFGYTFFSYHLKLGISLLSGWLTLSLMTLPIIIRGSEEALRMIPYSFREAAIGLGATKWEAVRDNVLPVAAPGIATSIILAVARIAGEVAAILFTACVLTMRGLPDSILEPVMTLSYYLFVMLVTSPKFSISKAFATATVLLLVVIFLVVVATAIRTYYRRIWKW